MKQITLLDGTLMNQDDLIANCYSDEFYYGYLGQNALSSSSIKMLLDSPKTYKYVTKYSKPETQALRDGSLFHTMLLEPEKLNSYVFVDVQSKNTNKYKEAKEYHSDVYTKKEKQDAERLVDAIYKNKNAVELLSKASFEVPMVDNLFEFPFRAKADILKNSSGIVDLKTTTDVRGFDLSAKKYRYDVQVYIYCNLFNVHYTDWRFLCIDKGSLDIGIFEVSKEFYERGEQLTKIGIQYYKEFIEDKDYDLNNYCIYGKL
jgi:hypothetical protein